MGASYSTNRFIPCQHWLSLCVALGGCADDPTRVVWGGSEIHFVIDGVNEGTPQNRSSFDADMLALASFHCERTYEVPEVGGVADPSMARLVAMTVSTRYKSPDDRIQTIAISLVQHDLQADELGATLRVVPRREGELIESNELIFEMSRTDALLNEDFLHAAAKIGEVTL